MGATYTRQSTSAIVDGGVIEASDINAEFNQILAAFAVTSGHTHDGTTAEGGPITKLLGNTITIGDGSAGTDIAITFDGESNDGVLTWMEDEDYFQFSDDLLVTTTEKLQFRDTAIYINSSADGQLDLVADTEIQIAATTIDINGAVDVSGTLTLDTITNNATDITLDSSGDIILDADGADIFLKDAGTTYGSLTNSSGNLIVKSGTTTALTFSGADVTVAGDLTVSGDDITMGTNTAGHLLIADGTNFNSVAVGSLSEISSIASDDVFLAVDTSGGGLKKVSRSTVVSGLATSSAISNVSEDTTPQLGGNLDVNGNDIVTTSNADIELAPNGTGKVVIKGNTNQGKIVLNCEANSHGQTIIAAPHSESANNVLTLPSTGGDSRLVSATSTATLTNKTLTTPVIAEIDSGSSITLDATTDIVLDAGGADVILKDDGTTFGSLTNSSGELVIKSGSTPTTAMTFNGANVTFAGTVTIGSAGISEAELEILDGATVTTTELNIIDGDTSASSTTLVDADRIVTNDNGTMKQVALTDVKTYLSSAGFATDDPTALAIALG